MGKKLLFLIFIFIAYISPTIGMAQAQCADSAPTVTISYTGASSICDSDSISINSTINPTSQTIAYKYQWQVNLNSGSWNDISGATSSNLTNYSPAKGNNRFRIIVTYCDSTPEEGTVTSAQSGNITVNAVPTPSVTISASKNNVCPLENVVFTAAPVNGGSSPIYIWRINNVDPPVQSNSTNTFSTKSLNNGDSVTVELISNATCASSTPVASTPISMVVKPDVPSIPLKNSGPENVCPGTSNLTYSVDPDPNATTATSYEWSLPPGWTGNSTTNSITTTSGNTSGPSAITVKAKNNCGTSDPLTIAVTVDPVLTPTVSITATTPTVNDTNQPITICAGDNVVYTAQPTNEGSSASYIWRIGNTVQNGFSGNTFDTSNLTNGQVVSVELTNSNATCANPTSATSNSISTTVNPILNPSVTITADKSHICSGTSVNFSATATNAGSNPIYDWKVDGVSKQSSSSSNFPHTFTNTSNPDKIYNVSVEITPTDPCSTPVSKISEPIPITVTWQKPAQPGIISGKVNVCPVVNGLVYSVDEVPNATSYTWTLPTGWVVNGDATSNQITVNTTNNAVRNTNTLKVTANNVCGSSVERTLLIDVADFVEVHAGPDQTICKTVNVVNLVGAVKFGSGSGQVKKLNPRWIKVTGDMPGTFGDPTNFSTTYTPSAADRAAGSVLLALITDKPAGNCPAGRDEIEIKFYQDATANAGDDITVCEGAPVNLTGIIGGSATSSIWSSSGGTFSNTSSLNTIFTPTTTGAIDVTLTAKGPCPPNATDIMTITVNPLASVNAGNDFSICSNENANITATIGGGATSGLWSTTGDGVFDNESALTSNYTPGTNDKSSGTATLTFTTNDPNGPCEFKEDSLVLIIEPEVVVDAGEDQIICSNGNVTLNGAIIGGTSSGNWGTSGTGTFNNTSLMNAIYTPSPADISTGNVTLTLTSANPGGRCAVVSDDVVVTINPAATVDAGSDQIICSNSTFTLVNALFGGGATEAKWEIISGGGTLSSTNFSTSPKTVTYTPTPNQSGTAVLRLTTDDPDGPCESIYDEITVNISKEVTITNQPLNQSVCATNPVTFSVTATGDNLIYQWYKVGSIDDIKIPGATSNVLTFNQAATTDSGNYYVEVSNSNCSSSLSEEVNLNVDEDIVITVPAEDVSICQIPNGPPINFTVVAHANGTSALSFNWFKDGNPLDTEIDAESATGNGNEYTSILTISDPKVADGGEYWVEVIGTDPDFSCPMATTKSFRLTVNITPGAPVVQYPIIEYCVGASALALEATATSNAELRWYDKDKTLLSEAPIPLTTSVGSTIYYASQKLGECETLEGEWEEITVIINDLPTVAIVTPLDPIICTGSPITLEASGATSYVLDPNPSNASWTTSGTTGNITVSPTETTTYTVTGTDDNGCSNEATITVIVDEISVAGTVTGTTKVCSGNNTGNINLTSRNGDVIRWESSLDENSWAEITDTVGKDVIQFNNITESTYFRAVVQNGVCNEVYSEPALITVDEVTVPGNINGKDGVSEADEIDEVCISGNSGSLELTEYLGEIVEWQSSIGDSSSFSQITPLNNTPTLSYSNLSQTTWYRVKVKNGECSDAFSSIFKIQVDALPVGGELTFGGSYGSTYALCDNASSGLLNPPITLINEIGTIKDWEMSSDAGVNWKPVKTSPHISDTFNGYSNITTTTIFRAVIENGVCGTTYSRSAVINIIPSNIKPSPVTASPKVLCLGDPVTLSSQTGYGSSTLINDTGNFNVANSMTNNGWRVRHYPHSGKDLNFPANGDDLRPRQWSNTNDHPFYVNNVRTGIAGVERIDSREKKFAIVSGGNPSTLETPIFNTLGLDNFTLTYFQAYNLVTENDIIQVQISTDGGNSYPTIIKEIKGIANSDALDRFGISNDPRNKISIDLNNYVGQSNLRIRFLYNGATDGSIWAIDGISLPDKPLYVNLEWRDNTATDPGELIGTTETVIWTPKFIGENIFEVTTFIVTDDAGNRCTTEGNSESVTVFVFDQYTTTVTTEGGTCGAIEVQLKGIIDGASQGPIDNIPTLDGYEAAWKITGPTGYTFSPSHLLDQDGNPNAINDPNAVFKPGLSGAYTISWEMTPTKKDINGNIIVNEGCPPIHIPFTIDIEDCTTLDFDGVDDYVDLGTTYTGTYSLEAWIRPYTRTDNQQAITTNPSNGTIISGPGYELSLVAGKPSFTSSFGTVTSSTAITMDSRWYHIAASSEGKLYVDGVEAGNGNINTTGTGSSTLIGAKYNSTTGQTENHFSGWIEEVRIWNTSITKEQIRFLMNQHLQSTGNIGVEIPTIAPGNLQYSSLAGYYRLISKVPDPDPITSTIVTFPANTKPLNGFTPDLTGKYILGGRLHNMETNQQNTAPMPYISAKDGDWETVGSTTWLRPSVWDDPNSNGITGDPIDWNIVRINHNINSGDRDITVLGLKSETVGKLLNISAPGTQNEYNAGHMLRVTHYLLLDGNMDLVGESQLLQDEGSILAESSKGWLERDQQGKKMSFNYNYWSSPVSAQGKPNNSDYLPGDVMHYNTGSEVQKLQFTADSDPYGADNTDINTCPYWLWKFKGTADNYDSWIFIGSTGSLRTGEGHTMKGTFWDGKLDYSHSQNYIYKGKPHNGDFNLNIGPNLNYLIGNPYPSALDVKEFIRDNIEKVILEDGRESEGRNDKNIFDGTVYLWDHFSGGTHILREYIGGYATLNLLGGVEAIATDDRINSNTGLKTDKTPKHFIPVGQGFFINTDPRELPVAIPGGDVVFKNSQRVFQRESTGNSIFLKPETAVKIGKEEAKSSIPKIRISFRSPKGYNRQLLVGAHPSTTNGFDLGYDAPMIEYNVEDMYWVQGNNYLVIQGVPDFGKSQVLPLGIRIEKEGEFKIKIDTLENINNDHNIYLKDITLDTIHDIRSGPYISTSAPGEITQRFQLVFHKESQQDPIVDEPIIDEPIIDDNTEISLLHSYTENEMMVLNPQELLISAIYLFDMNGKLLSVFEDVPSEREIRLKVANFSEGVYVLKMHTDTEIVTRKIIIKN